MGFSVLSSSEDNNNDHSEKEDCDNEFETAVGLSGYPGHQSWSFFLSLQSKMVSSLLEDPRIIIFLIQPNVYRHHRDIIPILTHMFQVAGQVWPSGENMLQNLAKDENISHFEMIATTPLGDTTTSPPGTQTTPTGTPGPPGTTPIGGCK